MVLVAARIEKGDGSRLPVDLFQGFVQAIGLTRGDVLTAC